MPAPTTARPRAIIFDAGNTLLRIDYAAIAAHLGRRGRRVAPEEVEDAELRARVRLDVDLAAGASSEALSTGELYLRYVLLHLDISAEDEVQAIGRWRRDYNPPVGLWGQTVPGAADVLRRVKAAGLVAGVVSNSNGSVRSILEQTGLTRDLDFVIDSAIVGVEKPDPRIFAVALEHAKVPADTARYIGDIYSVDVIGARRAGLGAVLLDPKGYWGPRDCPVACDLDEAVNLCLGEEAFPSGGS